ncbi:LolA family protein [Nocardioides lijunqiniae]|uniref:LolA family protein n=1 Tax=Nocardioides lijunqiniae TaxID=2760832 RepID=UPI0018786F8E|nr:hypothetical protein [Nocardioides lijunqiniae]
MSRSLFRRTASAAVLSLALTSLAACGGDDESGDDSGSGGGTSAFDRMGGSEEPTDGATDEPTEESTEEAEPTAGEEVEASEMVGIFAAAFEEASTATFTMNIEGAAAYEADGQADFTQTPTAMSMSINVGEMQPIKMVLVDNTLYQQNPGTEKYTSTSLDDPSNPLSSLGDQLDIRSQFDTMEKAITGATYVGEEDGLEHYSIVLDSATLLEAQDADTTSLPEGSLPPSFTYELFFDDEGYFRKMVADLGELGGEMTASYDNWGEPVDIKAPPASQIQ